MAKITEYKRGGSNLKLSATSRILVLLMEFTSSTLMDRVGLMFQLYIVNT
jgi:hypothetical protein